MVNAQSFVRTRRPKYKYISRKAALIALATAATFIAMLLVTYFESNLVLARKASLATSSAAWILTALILFTDFRIAPWTITGFAFFGGLATLFEVVVLAIYAKDNLQWTSVGIEMFAVIGMLGAFQQLFYLNGCGSYMDSLYNLPVSFNEDGSIIDVMDRETTETRAGLLNQLYFWWALPVITRGYRNKKLEMGDLVSLAPSNNPRMIYSRFDSVHSKGGHSLLNSLYECNKDSFWLCGFVLLISSAVGFLSPVLLEKLLNHVADAKEDTSHGYVLAGLLFFVKVVQSILEHQFWIVGVRCGMRCQSALMTKVYSKALKLSQSSLRNHSLGQIVNFMSVDAARISDSSAVQMFHWGSWSALLSLVVCIYSLHRILGYSMIIGFIIIMSFWPVAIFLVRKVKAASNEVQEKKDERAKSAGEALTMIKLIKSLQWEGYVLDVIGRKRTAEVKAQVRRSVYGGLIQLWNNLTQIAAPISTFVVYSIVEGKPLTAAVAFTSLTWFAMLTRVLQTIPGFLTSAADCLTSLDRLEKFLNSGELPKQANLDDALEISLIDDSVETGDTTSAEEFKSDKNTIMIEIRRGFFAWGEGANEMEEVNIENSSPKDSLLSNAQSISSAENRYVLHNINLSIEKGSLVFIVGPVGSGMHDLRL